MTLEPLQVQMKRRRAVYKWVALDGTREVAMFTRENEARAYVAHRNKIRKEMANA